MVVFVDLIKAFDLVDHAVLLQMLKSIGLANSDMSQEGCPSRFCTGTTYFCYLY